MSWSWMSWTQAKAFSFLRCFLPVSLFHMMDKLFFLQVVFLHGLVIVSPQPVGDLIALLLPAFCLYEGNYLVLLGDAVQGRQANTGEYDLPELQDVCCERGGDD